MPDDPFDFSPQQIERSLRAAAPFYDLDFGPLREDVELWRQIASRWTPARILELGAGSGRVAAPLAEDGHHVTALDASPTMLGLGCKRMRAAGVRVVQADMRSLPDGLGEFDLILCALGTFQHLLRRADQLAALQNAARLLAPGGQLALDVTAPRPEDLDPDPQPLRLEWTREHPSLGTVLKLAGQELAEPRCAEHPPDAAAPLAWLTYVYETAQTRAIARFPMRVALGAGELEGLLRQAGLAPDSWYGSWSLDPLGCGDRVIVLSAPAARA